MRADVIEQALAIAMHPDSDCDTAIVSASMILGISQSPETHVYIIRKEVMEKMFEMCELKCKTISEQSHQRKKEDPMAATALKYVTTFYVPFYPLLYSLCNLYLLHTTCSPYTHSLISRPIPSLQH